MDDYEYDIDENPYEGMTGQEVLELKRRELDTLYSEIKLLDEALPRGRDDAEPIVSESEAYAMIMDLRAQLKMAKKENESLVDEKRVLDRLIRTKDQALVQLTEELQASSDRLLNAEARLRESESVSATEALSQRAHTLAAADAAAERARRDLERDMERVTAAKKERPDPEDPFYDLVVGLENKNTELSTEIDTLNKHIRLLTGETRRKDRTIAQITAKLEENTSCQSELVAAQGQIDHLKRELSDLRLLYTKLTHAVAGEEDTENGHGHSEASPLSPGGERALSSMDVEEIREVVRNKQRILRVLEEENAVLREKQLEWESANSQVLPMDSDASANMNMSLQSGSHTQTAQPPSMLKDYHERRLLQVEVKKLRESRVLQDKTIRAQQTRINQLTDRLDFVAKSLREVSKAHRRASETAPEVSLGDEIPHSSQEYRDNHQAKEKEGEGEEDDVVSGSLYDLVVSRLIEATKLSNEVEEALNERQMALERAERTIAILEKSNSTLKLKDNKVKRTPSRK